jgi:hypothetical protein
MAHPRILTLQGSDGAFASMYPYSIHQLSARRQVSQHIEPGKRFSRKGAGILQATPGGRKSLEPSSDKTFRSFGG